MRGLFTAAGRRSLLDDADRVAVLQVLQAVNHHVLAGGEAAQRISEARAQVQAHLTSATRSLKLFHAEVAAFEAAPRLYKSRKYLTMLQGAVQHIRKYVIVAHPDTNVIIEYEKADKGTIDIGDTE